MLNLKKNNKKTFKDSKFREIDLVEASKIIGGRKKHKCRVYNNGMPTGVYRWC